MCRTRRSASHTARVATALAGEVTVAPTENAVVSVVVDEIGPHAARANAAITTAVRLITVARPAAFRCTHAGYAARITSAVPHPWLFSRPVACRALRLRLRL